MIVRGLSLKTALQGQGIRQEEAAKKLGVSRQTLSSWCNKQELTKDILQNVKTKLNIDLTSSQQTSDVVGVYTNTDKTNEAVPLNFLDSDNKFPNTQFTDIGAGRYLMVMPKVTEYAHAGYLAGYSDPEYLSELPKHSIIVDKYHFGQYRAFVGVGDSMDDGTIESIPHGSIITGRLINQILYQRDRLHLHRYKDFVIVHKEDGILVKRIIEHNVKEGTIICHSLNPDKDTYPDFKLNLQDIAELYNIIDVNIKR